MPHTSRTRHRLLAHAHQILTLFRGPPVEPVSVLVEEDGVRVVVRIEAVVAATAQPREPRYPGLFFSPTELLIWRALEKGPLVSREIAEAIGQEHSSKLRTILANLEYREVIHNDNDRQGYQRAELQADGVPTQPQNGRD